MKQTPKRALLVVDAQNEYVTGKLRVEFPPVGTSLGNIGAAMDAAAQAGIPIVVVQQTDPEPQAALFAQDSHSWHLHEAIAGRPADHRISKSLPSAFAGTDLEEWLRTRNVDTLTVVGYMTHNCDHSSVNDAVHAGFAVEVLSDATGTIPLANSAGNATAEEIHRIFTVVMQSRFAAVLSTAQWTRELSTGGAARPTGILRSHQQALAIRSDITA